MVHKEKELFFFLLHIKQSTCKFHVKCNNQNIKVCKEEKKRKTYSKLNSQQVNGFQIEIQAKMIKYFNQEKILIVNLKFCK